MQFTITINGKKTVVEERPETSLLDALRRQNLYSVRRGCETANCGICTVWLDGTPVLSCSVPVIRADQREVTTVEGVREEAEPLVELLSKEGADQCGYCAPGLIMTVLALKRSGLPRDDESIRHYLNGNLCRCSGYESQMRAIRQFLKE